MRMLVAAVALVMLLNLARSGVMEAIWLAKPDGLQRVESTHWLWSWLDAPTPANVWMLWRVAIGAAVAVLVGFGGRIGALVLLQVLLALLSLQPSSNGGYDMLLNNALWLLVLAPCEATLSLWCRLRTGAWRSNTPRLAWVRYAAVYQLTVMYVATGVQKVGVDWWPWGGLRALDAVLQQPPWTRLLGATWLAWLSPFTAAATVATVVWEATWFVVPLALYFRATRLRAGPFRSLSNRLNLRTQYVLLGLVMHLGVVATLNVGTFSWIALAMYPCLFHHDEWVNGWHRVRHAWRMRE